MSKKPKSKKTKILLTILFVLINVGVIAITAFSEFGNPDGVSTENVEFNFWYLLPAFFLFITAIFFEVFRYMLMMRKTSDVYKGKGGFRKAWKFARNTVLIGRYYDNITPAAIGGQPFQIYYMNKNAGLKGGLATTIPIMGMISGQIGFIIIAVLCFLFASASTKDVALMAAACFGLLFYAFWPILVLIATFLPKSTSELIVLFVRLFVKLHIIKDKDKAIARADRGVSEYSRCVKMILKTRGLFLKTILVSVLFHVLFCSIPFFVLTAFGGHIEFLPCFVTTVAVTSAIYFVPTPGNAGAAEGTFFVVFSALSSGSVFWAMLTWRFFSYYSYIIMGGITYLLMYIDKKRALPKKTA